MNNKEYETHQRRLSLLKARAAALGLSTPPEVWMEIEDIEHTLNIKSKTLPISEERLFDCGHRIKAAREEINLSISEFIELIDYKSEKNFNQIESRQMECPLSIILTISEAIGVSVEWLKHNKQKKYPVLFAPIYWTPQFLHHLKLAQPEYIYFCTELETHRVLTLTQTSTYKWNIFQAGATLAFWDWIDDFNHIPEVYDSLCETHHTYKEVYSIIFEQDLFNQLEEGNIHPYRAIELLPSKHSYWSDDITHIQDPDRTATKYRQEYGDWFVKAQNYFRKYKNSERGQESES